MNKKSGFFLVLGILGILGAGIVTGHILQAQLAPTIPTEPKVDSLLSVGDLFPSVELAAVDGSMVATDDLVEQGGVVLFLDPACDPCSSMSERWQTAIDRGHISSSQVVGVTLREADVESYRQELGLSLEIYQDLTGEFMNSYEVKWIPYEIVVDPDGTIRSMRGNEEGDIDRQWLQDLIAG